MKKIKSYYKNRLLFIKYLRDNPGTDIPIPDDKRQDWCPLKEVGDADDQ